MFKNFPLTNIHPRSRPVAVGASCVYKQEPDVFRNLHNPLFQQQSQINPQTVKDRVIAAAGDCIDYQRTLPEVKADQQEGQGVGVNGIPAFFINGRFLSGAVPYEQFKAVIDDELASNRRGTEAPAHGAPPRTLRQGHRVIGEGTT